MNKTRNTQFLVAGAFFVAVALVVGAFSFYAFGAPQTTNGTMSRTQIDQTEYNKTYGTRQVTILAQIPTTPQTTNGTMSITQMLQAMHNKTYGAQQVVLSTSTGKQVPFTNLTSLVDGDVLYYSSAGEEWKNSHALEIYENQLVTQHAGQAIHRTNSGAANYNPSALTTDYLIVANNSALARAITISTEDVQSGSTDNPRIFLIKDEYGAAGTYNLTVSLESGNIDGAASQTISVNYAAIQLYCDGTNCFIF